MRGQCVIAKVFNQHFHHVANFYFAFIAQAACCKCFIGFVHQLRAGIEFIFRFARPQPAGGTGGNLGLDESDRRIFEHFLVKIFEADDRANIDVVDGGFGILTIGLAHVLCLLE